jgi:hypothetical protein
VDGRRAEHSLIPLENSPLALQINPNVILPITSSECTLGSLLAPACPLKTAYDEYRGSPLQSSLLATLEKTSLVPQSSTRVSGPAQGTSGYSCPISGALTRSENSIETLVLTRGGCKPSISNNSSSSRYELRPNRPSTFPPRKPQYLIDRYRFPHIFRSKKYSLDQHGFSDSDYTPPSRTLAPSSSDRSVSIISSLPSTASNLELFGLEVRSLQSLDRGSASSEWPNDVSSPDFFSSEEHSLPT